MVRSAFAAIKTLLVTDQYNHRQFAAVSHALETRATGRQWDSDIFFFSWLGLNF